MQHSTREKVLLAFVVASLIFYVFMFLATTKTIVNVSAVEVNGVGVYEDSDCSIPVDSIEWGTLYPGSVENKKVYIRNNNDTEPMYLILSTKNWDPLNASDFLELTWNYTLVVLAPEDVVPIELTLSCSEEVEGIDAFSFDILVTGSDRFPGDANGDGFVGLSDLAILGEAWYKRYGDPGYDARADFDGDGFVGLSDLAILGEAWYKRSET